MFELAAPTFDRGGKPFGLRFDAEFLAHLGLCR
jgi:hypothetical protein